MLQHVRQRWITIYFACIGCIELLSLLVFVWHYFAPNSITTYAEVTVPTAITAAIYLIFMVTIYPLLAKKAPQVINMLGSVLIGLFLAASVATANDVWHFRVLFVIICLLTTMAGVLVPLVIVGISWVMLIMVVVETLPGLIWRESLINTLGTIGVLIGWLIFRRWYITSNKDDLDEHLTAQLMQEQYKSGVLLEYITDGVMIINPIGTVQSLNASAAAMLGWSKDEAVNLDYRSLIQLAEQAPKPDGNPDEAAITTTLRTRESIKRISLIKTKNNREIFVDIAASPITQKVAATKDRPEEETLQGVIAVLRNVDKQKREEQQRSDFISTASHEMRTPVAAIQGYIELALNQKVAVIDEKARGYLMKAHESTKHLGRLFQDLLTISRSEDGRLINNPKLIEANEFLKETIEPERMQAEKKGLKLLFDEAGDERSIKPLVYVNVDPDRLREVLMNLFENAIKYTSTGIITLGTSLQEQSVVLRISDTGMGIAAEDIPHLFQKFYRTDSTATREIGGTGLGLYICKQLVELMHGEIWVESTVGAGSTFYIKLPRVPPEIIQRSTELKT